MLIQQVVTDPKLLFFIQLFQGFIGNPVADVTLAFGGVLMAIAVHGRAIAIHIGSWITIEIPPRRFGRKPAFHNTPLPTFVHPPWQQLSPPPRLVPQRGSSNSGFGQRGHISTRRPARPYRLTSRTGYLPRATRIGLATLGLSAILLAGCLSWASEQPSARAQALGASTIVQFIASGVADGANASAAPHFSAASEAIEIARLGHRMADAAASE
jgi:hypothetical protein